MERMRDLLTECFGTEIKEEDEKLKTSYGVLKEITVWIHNKKMCVETAADNTGATDELILDTNKRFRTFLDKSTGYSSKDRVKNAKKEVAGE